jgi:hypothetical protein
MDRMPDSVVTCEAVLTEACFLVARGRMDPGDHPEKGP